MSMENYFKFNENDFWAYIGKIKMLVLMAGNTYNSKIIFR